VTDSDPRPRGPVDAEQVPRFAGPETFARLPRLDEVGRCDVAVVGVPLDSGVSYRPGARFGPGAIRAASKIVARIYHQEMGVAPFAAQQVADAGDVACTPYDVVRAVGEIESAARGLADRCRHLVALGGDHTVALPLLRAAHARAGEVAVVHFDAHLDTWDTSFGAEFNHGSPFRRASEEGLLALGKCIHVGIRGAIEGPSDLDDDARLGFQVVPTMAAADDGPRVIVERIRARVGDAPVYVSIDIDVLDPAHAPGTGVPEPGGLTTRELQAMLRGMRGLPIVAADVVEVAPAYDHAEITAMAAASLAYELTVLFAFTPDRAG
jgi:agmatinase